MKTEIRTKNLRQRPRAKVVCTLRVRSKDPRFGDQIVEADNVSRTGVHFETESRYYVGMEVLVTRNYQPNDPVTQEELGKVVRVDKLKSGNWGIAIRL